MKIMSPFHWILVVIGSFMIISALWMNIRFIRDYTKKEQKKFTKTIFALIQVFFIFIIFTMIAIVAKMFIQNAQIAGMLITIGYSHQVIFLLIVLFVRFYLVFKNSLFALTKKTINIYIIVLVLSYLYIATMIALFKRSSFFFTVVALIVGLTGIINCSLSLMFVYKLIQVNKGYQKTHDRNDRYLLNLITKTSICTITSNIATLFAVGGFALYATGQSTTNHLILASVELIDCYTNFVSVSLSFGYFDIWYDKLCGFVDKRCKALCVQYVGDDDSSIRMGSAAGSAASSDFDSDSPNHDLRGNGEKSKETVASTSETETVENKPKHTTVDFVLH